MTDYKHDERQRAVEQALQELRQLLLEIGASVGKSLKDRCPNRMADDTCTFEGVCHNRIARISDYAICGGDDRLNRLPAERG